MKIPLDFKQYNLRRNPTPTERSQLILLFSSWVLYYLFDLIHTEFIIKSKGYSDSLGVKWKPLSESRRLYKPLQRGERTQFKIGRRKRTKKELLADRNPPINIDTKRLINALAPGKVIGWKYVPPNPDQQVLITEQGIQIKINIPYADDVQEVRPYFPESIDPWLRIAIEKATPHLIAGFAKYVLI
jgi:hypothetical protein